MKKTDLHVHTTFSDGENTPEEMVLAAIENQMDAIGFSDHAHTAFDESYCMQKENVAAYRAEIGRLREKYRDKIRVLCGIEQDYYADTPTDGYDFVIGSVHYLRFGDEYVPVDEGADLLRAAADRHLGGDLYALAGVYYSTVADVVRRTGATVIGHFDLIAKYNGQSALFDVQNPRYRAAWQSAADALLATGVPFEINTGAIFRGVCTEAYPSREIRAYLSAHGAKFLLSGDAHTAKALCYRFDDAEAGKI